eukprot:GILI01022744.1.p1 GENE.GILI01022744.1~~GILI01022744.1.p1  ORF type:complete len:154 (-),score=20.95 GILI01022744.1:111-572(-)
MRRQLTSSIRRYASLISATRLAHHARYYIESPDELGVIVDPNAHGSPNAGGIDLRTDSGTAAFRNGYKALDEADAAAERLYPSRTRLEASLMEEEALADGMLNVYLPLSLNNTLDKYSNSPNGHAPLKQRPHFSAEYRRLADGRSNIGNTKSK